MQKRAWLSAAICAGLWSVGSVGALGQGAAVDEIKACVEGVFDLAEFRRASGETFQAPLIAGRYVIQNGAVIFVFHARIQDGNHQTHVGLGKYTVTEEGFGLAYEDYTLYFQKPDGISVERRLPWSGFLYFAPVIEQGALRLRTADGKQVYDCAQEGLRYSAGFSRLYRRITQ
jgi:hypothetical protein